MDRRAASTSRKEKGEEGEEGVRPDIFGGKERKKKKEGKADDSPVLSLGGGEGKSEPNCFPVEGRGGEEKKEGEGSGLRVRSLFQGEK